MKRLSLAFALLAFILVTPLSYYMPTADKPEDTSYSSAEHHDQYLTAVRAQSTGVKDITQKTGNDVEASSSTVPFSLPLLKVLARFSPVPLDYSPSLTSGGFGNRAGPLAVI